VGNFARNEIEAAARRLVIEENAGRGEDAVTFPVIHRHEMTIGFETP